MTVALGIHESRPLGRIVHRKQRANYVRDPDPSIWASASFDSSQSPCCETSQHSLPSCCIDLKTVPTYSHHSESITEECASAALPSRLLKSVRFSNCLLLLGCQRKAEPESRFLSFFLCLTGIIETWGKYDRLANAGCNVIICPMQSMVGKISFRVQQLNVRVETKTLDNVFLTAVVSVQYQVLRDKVYEAFYALTNPNQQITAHVYDVIRAQLPHLELDAVFEAKEELALAVKNALSETMTAYGYQIVNTLITGKFDIVFCRQKEAHFTYPRLRPFSWLLVPPSSLLAQTSILITE